MHILACPPIKVPHVGNLIPSHYIEALEQNQQIALCCRHPEDHTVEAWFSSEADRDIGRPDIYIFTCTCGRKHSRFCVGGGERPYWEVH